MTYDQKIVLEYLESQIIDLDMFPLAAIGLVLNSNFMDTSEGDKLFDSYERLTPAQEWQVLEEFIKWRDLLNEN